MDIQSFLAYIKSQQIPPAPPDGLTPGGHGFLNLPNYLDYYQARDQCTKLGMWCIVDQVWTKILSGWIEDRKVLEVMAGGGWLAKALSDQGVDIIATDDFSWNDNDSEIKRVYPIQKMDAVKAADSISADILLISWPPYGDDTIINVCNAWGVNRPIIYIGEYDGGCNAPAEFFERFQEIQNQINIPMVSWDCIHDMVLIGYWT